MENYVEEGILVLVLVLTLRAAHNSTVIVLSNLEYAILAID